MFCVGRVLINCACAHIISFTVYILLFVATSRMPSLGDSIYYWSFAVADVLKISPCSIFTTLLDLPDAMGRAPLHLAEQEGMYSRVEVLLEYGAG